MKKLTFLLFAVLYTGLAYALLINNETINKQQVQPVVLNDAPVANAGNDAVAFEGDTVVLNGSLSYDHEKESLTYLWRAPNGIILSDTTIANPSFIAPKVSVDTTYTFSLVVNDGTIDSNVDHVSITVKKENKVPVAIACADVEKYEGDTLTLDGSLSYDPEGRPMTYIWTTLEGITLSANERSKIPFTVPRFLKDTVLVISLVVNDGLQNSLADQFSITVWHINMAPLCEAGKNQTVDEGSRVTLDGSASKDPEKRPLIYQWTAPQGITLSSATDPKPTFTAPEVAKDSAFYFTLVVNDGMADSEPDKVRIIVRQVNKAPVARVDFDSAVDEGTLVTLDGSLSSDDDGDPLIYKWIAPSGITLTNTGIAKTTFIAPEVAKDITYLFSLIINDGKVDSQPMQVNITVRQINKVPVANALLYQAASEGETVTLDGSLSSDADGDPLIYKWTAPKGIALSSTVSAHPTFIAPEVYIDTLYTFILVVNDGIADSPPQTVKVSVKNIVKPMYYKVYPNPTTGAVRVEYSRTPEKHAEAIISTISGHVIMRKNITERLLFHIDLSGNSSGVYILSILDNNQRYNQQIILKGE